MSSLKAITFDEPYFKKKKNRTIRQWGQRMQMRLCDWAQPDITWPSLAKGEELA